MYTIEVDGYCIYDNTLPMEEFQLDSPELTLEVNSSGSLIFTILPSNRGYDKIKINESYIVVYDNGEEIWAGRPIKEDIDFYNNKKFTCEGELGFLNDTRAPSRQCYNQKIFHEYDGNKIGYVNMLLARHNNQSSLVYTLPGDDTDSVYDKKFYTGICRFTKNMPNDTECQCESTFEAMNKMVSYTRCYMMIRKEVENGVTKKYLDWLRKVDIQNNKNTQTIHFGSNLMSFAKAYNWNIVTALMPYMVIDEEKIVQDDQGNDVQTTESKTYTLGDALLDTVDSTGKYWHKGHSEFVYDKAGIKKYGWVCQSIQVDFDPDAYPGTPNQKEYQLLEAAYDYLDNYRLDYMSVEISGFDLQLLGVNVEKLKFMHYTHIISEPHDFDDWLLLTKMEIKMNKPEETVYTFGHTYTKYMSWITGQLASKVEGFQSTTSFNQSGGG